MTNSAAYKLLAVMIAFAIPYELLLAYGPGSDQEFEGYWQVWHPYFLPLIGLTILPILFGYVFPLARRLGGRGTLWGRCIWFLAAGLLAYTAVGTTLIFLEATCASWGSLACDNELGRVPHPSLGTIGFIAMYPLVGIGLAALLQGLGTSAWAELRRHWWIPLGITIVTVAFAAPFGFDLAFDERESTLGAIADAAVLVGMVAITSLAGVAAPHARRLGGALRRPVYFQLAGIVLVSIGTFIMVHNNTVGRELVATDQSAGPFTIGFVLWLASFLMIGAALEKMLGIGPSRVQETEAPADESLTS
jgi:hypothetical protein